MMATLKNEDTSSLGRVIEIPLTSSGEHEVLIRNYIYFYRIILNNTLNLIDIYTFNGDRDRMQQFT